MRKLIQELVEFSWAIISRVAALGTGGVITLSLFVYEHEVNHNVSMDIIFYGLAAYFFVGCFLIWQKEHRERIALQGKLNSPLVSQRAIPRTVTAATTITSTDTVIRFDAASGEIAQSLPPVTDLNDGQRLNLHKIDNTHNKIIFQLNGTDTFSGFNEIFLNRLGASVTLEANVSYRQWFVNP